DLSGLEISQSHFQNLQLTASKMPRLKLSHNAFQQSEIVLHHSQHIHISGNLFDAQSRIQSDSTSHFSYIGYNVYPAAENQIWLSAGNPWSSTGRKEYSPGYLPENTSPDLLASMLSAMGPTGMPAGPFRYKPETKETVSISGPWIHSVTDTTVNLEWASSSRTDNPEQDSGPSLS